MGWPGWPNASVMSAGRLVVRRRHTGGARPPSCPRRDLLRRRGRLRDLCRQSGDGDCDGSGISRVHRCPSRLRAHRLGGGEPIVRPALDLVAATVAGLALAAPPLLPGVQLNAISARQLCKGQYSLTLHELNYLIFQSFDGIPWGNGPHLRISLLITFRLRAISGYCPGVDRGGGGYPLAERRSSCVRCRGLVYGARRIRNATRINLERPTASRKGDAAVISVPNGFRFSLY